MRTSSVVEQLHSETASWRRVLQFLAVENAHLKTRIAEIAGHEVDNEILRVAEEFQNQFIQVDELLGLLKRDVLAFKDEVERELEPGTADRILLLQKKTRKDIEQLEQRFQQIKSRFNHYFTGQL